MLQLKKPCTRCEERNGECRFDKGFQRVATRAYVWKPAFEVEPIPDEPQIRKRHVGAVQCDEQIVKSIEPW